MYKDMFVKNVKVQNYRSLDNLSIRLNRGLNIIIGENGSGKSNFLKYLNLQLPRLFQWKYADHEAAPKPYAESTHYEFELEKQEGEDLLKIGVRSFPGEKGEEHTGPQRKIVYSATRNGEFRYQRGITVPTKEAYEDLSEIMDLILEMQQLGAGLYVDFIQFEHPRSIQFITMPGGFSVTHVELDLLMEDAWEYEGPKSSPLFGNALKDLLKPLDNPKNKNAGNVKKRIMAWFGKRKTHNDYVKLLNTYSPISDVRLNDNMEVTVTRGSTLVTKIQLEFKVNDKWLTWSYLSDGATRLFHIITEMVFGRGSIVLLEEPELGIHPAQLYKLLDFIQLQGERRQIILSTHSPLALDILTPEDLDQIIIARMTKNGTQMDHLTDEQKEKATAYIKEVGSLSDYWLHSDLEP